MNDEILNKKIAAKLLKCAKDILAADSDTDVEAARKSEDDNKAALQAVDDAKLQALKKAISQNIKNCQFSASEKMGELIPGVGTVNMKTMKVIDFLRMIGDVLVAKGQTRGLSD